MNKIWWKNIGKWAAVGIVIAVLFFVLFFVWGVWGFPKLVPDVARRGQWGDSFGVVTAFVTALALGGLVWTIRQNSKQLRQNSEQLLQNSKQIAVQQEALEVQIEELKQTRKEMAGQTEQFAAQTRVFQLQSFENSFFQLLSQHNDIVNSIELIQFVGTEEKKYLGRKCFSPIFGWFRYFYNRTDRESGEDNEGLFIHSHIHECINEAYEQFFSAYQSHIGHCIRHLYNIFKFVDESELIEEGSKKRYADLIRALLSDDELKVLFYVCLSKREADFKPLVEKYAVFEDIDFTELLNDKHRILYEKSAFGSRLDDADGGSDDSEA